MNLRFIYYIIFLTFLLLNGSCKTEDIDPESQLGEIKIQCFQANFIDPDTITKELWIGYQIINRYLINIDFVGHCWNTNTDTFPTINSEIRKEQYLLGVWDLSMGGNLPPFQTGIPIIESYNKIIVRSFIIFSDSIIRYSTPLTVDNPILYAN
jgi:hypothetical protein